MFGILSNAMKTATREDAWSGLPERTQDAGFMAEVDRRMGAKTGRWAWSDKVFRR
ncbi:hypothetical protein [Roseobacter sp.]|uniref:hypothetical protein n=1 Tax=Roseobacter sp. TaxID=1907202 RepID=UPI003298F71E